MKGIVVSVGFDDLLGVTLPENAKHFDEVCVVTSPDDVRTQAVVAHVENAVAYTTDAFYREGATFNKGRAIEEVIESLGRWDIGWLCLFDADILMPAPLRVKGSLMNLKGAEVFAWDMMLPELAEELEPRFLYGPHRRNLTAIEQWKDYVDPKTWGTLPRAPDLEHGGYFHLFHTKDPVLANAPWYGVVWKHAAGYDSNFIAKWPREKHLRLPFEVLHLGEDGKNWWGRVSRRLDGTLPEGAKEAEERTAQMWTDRKRYGHRREKL